MDVLMTLFKMLTGESMIAWLGHLFFVLTGVSWFEFFESFLFNVAIEFVYLYLYWLHNDAYIGYYQEQLCFWIVPCALGGTIVQYVFW